MMVCGYVRREPGDRVQKTSAAYDATVAAHDARLALEAGKITLKEADAIELKRQDAVGKVRRNSFLFDMFGGRSKKADLPPPEQDGVVLENVDLFTFTENGKEVMAVSGVVHNTSAVREEMSPVTLAAIDQWEFILAGQTSLLPFEALDPGESKPFEMRFINPPDTTAEVYVHFAPPFEYRARRECEFAASGTSTPSLAPRSGLAAAMTASPVHTIAELNLLTRIYRQEAESSWNCRKGKDTPPPKGGLQIASSGSGERRGMSISLNFGKPNMELACAPAARRLPWRDMFALAEATDEAWGAALASEETHKRLAAGQATQAEADAAALAQQETYAVVRDLGHKALARVGGNAPDIAVKIAGSSYGHEELKGFYIDIAGTLHNTGASERQVESLMFALVDRLEQPIVSIRLDSDAKLAPGETKEFKQRVYFREPFRRRSQEETPAWEVRLAAVAR
jgi:hypothetical protein